jgi:hypothetical protein
MRINKTLLAGTFALCLATPSYASVGHRAYHRTYHRMHPYRGYDRTVDVAASPLPPLPTPDRVRVVNSAEHPIRHRGPLGVIERVHRAHMRLRAKIFRALSNH